MEDPFAALAEAAGGSPEDSVALEPSRPDDPFAEIARAASDPGAGEYVQQFALGVPKGVSDTAAGLVDIVGFVPGAGALLEALTGRDPHGYATALREWARSSFAPEAGTETFGATLGEAVGSGVGFLATGAPLGALGRAAGISEKVLAVAVPAGLGAALEAPAQFYEAEAHGASPTQQWVAFAGGLGIGSTEAFGIGRILGRVNRRSGGALRQLLVDGARESFEEGGQEFTQQTLGNLLAKFTYDDERKVLDGAFEGAAAGFLSGGILSAAASGVQSLGASSAAEDKLPESPAISEDTESLVGPTVETVGEDLPQVSGQIDPGSESAVSPEVGQVQADIARLFGPTATEAPVTAQDDVSGLLLDFAENRGRRLVFVEDATGGPLRRAGAYDRAAETIYVDRNAGPDAQLWGLLGHEMEHALRGPGEGSPEWQAQAEQIIEAAPEAFERFVDEYGRRYEAEFGQPLPPGLDEDEGVAFLTENLGGFLQFAVENPGVLESLTRENRTLLERISDVIIEFLRDLGVQIRPSVERKLDRLRSQILETPLTADLPSTLLRDWTVTIREALDTTLGQAPPLVVAQPPAKVARGSEVEGPAAEVNISQERAGAVATLPTEEGLFGEQERPPGAPRQTEGGPKAVQPNLLDVQEGDLPGQTSLLDAAEEAEPKAPKKPAAKKEPSKKVLEARARRAGEIAEGKHGLVPYVQMLGGLKWSADAEESASRAGGVRSDPGLSKLVQKKGSGKGVSLDSLIETLVQDGIWFPGATTGDITHADVLAAIEDNIRPATWEGDVPFALRPPAQSEFEYEPLFELPAPPRETFLRLLQRKFQDKFNRARVYQESLGEPIAEDEDVVLAEELFSGKTQAEVSKFERQHEKPITRLMGEAGIPLGDPKTPLSGGDRYLLVRDVESRNAIIAEREIRDRAKKIEKDRPGITAEDALAVARKTGSRFDPETNPGSGIPTSVAKAELEQFESGPQGDAYKELGRRASEIVKVQRDLLRDSGLLTKEEVKAYEDIFGETYVPHGDIVEQRAGIGRGFDIRGKETKRAKGRGLGNVADSPLTQLISATKTTIVRAEKNAVGQALGRLVDEHGNPNYWQKDAKVPEGASVAERKAWLDRTVHYKEDGVEHTVTFGDVTMANAFRNMQPENARAALNFLMGVQRVLSALNTSLDPTFVLRNFGKDVQTAFLRLAGLKDATIAARVVNPAQIKRAMGGIRQVQKYGDEASGEWVSHYREFVEAGGRVGFFHLPDMPSLRTNLERAIADVNPSKPRSAFLAIKKALEVIEAVNLRVENAVRLSAFVEARKAGLSKARAASLAKNLTVNFNRKGEWGPVLNAFYLFYNAGVQGSAAVLALVTTPRGRKVLGGLVIAGGVLDLLNYLIADEDDEGFNKYDSLEGWQKERQWILGDLAFPMPYGFNVPVVLGQNLMAAAMGRISADEAFARVTSAAWGSFNPIGSEATPLQAVAPTLLDPFVQLYENKTWYGTPLMPEQDPYGLPTPDSRRYWASDEGSSLQRLTTWLNDATGGSAARSGAIDVSPRTLEHWFQFATGGLGRTGNRVRRTVEAMLNGTGPRVSDVPFLRDLTVSPREGLSVSRFYDAARKVEEAAAHQEALLEAGRTEDAEAQRGLEGPLLDLAPTAKSVTSIVRRLRQYDPPFYYGKVDDTTYRVWQKSKPARGAIKVNTEAEAEKARETIMSDFNRLYRRAVLEAR